jgi:hypothetical protein
MSSKHSELKASLDYVEKLCLKNQLKKKGRMESDLGIVASAHSPSNTGFKGTFVPVIWK